MVSPSFLPDWVPPWLQPAIVPLGLLAGAVVVLLLPFAVFGVKGRLAALEAQIDDLGAEIRMLGLRVLEKEALAPRPLLRPVAPGPGPSRPADEESNREKRVRSPAPLPPRPAEPSYAADEEDGRPERRGRQPDDGDWYMPEDEAPPPRRPLRAPVDRAAERDPDRLRYSGRPAAGRSGSGDGRGNGEREEPSLRWPPR